MLQPKFYAQDYAQDANLAQAKITAQTQILA